MSLQQRSYSVLIASTADGFRTALSPVLPEATFDPIHTVSSISAAKRALAERAYDFVLINSPLSDDAGIRFSIDACASRGTVAVLFVKAEAHEAVYDKVVEHGVFTLQKPTPRQAISQALRFMIASRERLKKFEQKSLSIQEKMEEIRLVNRAKWLLISEKKMEEPQAHRYIEKRAMDECTTKGQIAEEIIRTYT